MKFIKLSDRKSYLQSIGASEEIIQYIESLDDTLATYITNYFRKNPNVTLNELKNIKSENKKLPIQNYELSITRQEYAQETGREPDKRTLFWFVVEIRKELRKNAIMPIDGDSLDIYSLVNYKQAIRSIFRNLYQIGFWDWINAFPHMDITGYSLDSAKQSCEEWHEQFKNGGKGIYLENTIFYGPTWKDKNGNEIQQYNGWTIREITTKNDLKTEGEKMGHCCGGYWDDDKNKIYRRGENVRIFSLRDPSNEPHVTIETSYDGNYCYQIQGKENSEPDEKYVEMIKEWNLYGNSPIKYSTDEGDIEAPSYNRYTKIWQYQDNIEKFFDSFNLVNEYGLKASNINILDAAINAFEEIVSALENINSNGYNSDYGLVYPLMYFIVTKGNINEINKFYHEIEEYMDKANENFNEYIFDSDISYPEDDEDEEAMKEYDREVDSYYKDYTYTGISNDLYNTFKKVLKEDKNIDIENIHTYNNLLIKFDKVITSKDPLQGDPFNTLVLYDFLPENNENLKKKPSYIKDNIAWIQDDNTYYLFDVKNTKKSFNLSKFKKISSHNGYGCWISPLGEIQEVNFEGHLSFCKNKLKKDYSNKIYEINRLSPDEIINYFISKGWVKITYNPLNIEYSGKLSGKKKLKVFEIIRDTSSNSIHLFNDKGSISGDKITIRRFINETI